jgi:membrane-bound lytic murein transglycosylase B
MRDAALWQNRAVPPAKASMPDRTRRSLVAAAAAAAALAASPRAPAAATTDFATWLAELRREAAGRGVSARVLDAALAGVQPIPRVLELDRNQPERRLTLEQYLERTVSRARIDQGRRLLDEHSATLAAVTQRFGVPGRFVVSLWGMESNFGQNMGSFRVVESLATLAYDGRRAEFFRGELIAALRILEQGHIAPDRMLGSWAGAMGQCQFMPSSFLRYAVDFDGDGRRDIWGTRPDVFGSAANYLAENGWQSAWTWGREVRVPEAVARGPDTGLDAPRPLSAWQGAGVRRTDGGPLPDAPIDAALVMPDGPGGRAVLAYQNYRVIMRWNRSTYFATAVGLLADAIGGA